MRFFDAPMFPGEPHGPLLENGRFSNVANEVDGDDLDSAVETEGEEEEEEEEFEEDDVVNPEENYREVAGYLREAQHRRR